MGNDGKQTATLEYGNAHLADFSRVKRTPRKAWLFQANPRYEFNLLDELSKANEDSTEVWTLDSSWKKITVGDAVILWQTTIEPAIYAIGEICDLPYKIADEWKVKLRYQYVLPRPIPRAELLSDANLREMHHLKMSQGTVKNVKPEEWNLIYALIQKSAVTQFAPERWWWCNQGKNYDDERRGGYVFGGITFDGRGAEPRENVGRLKLGNRILHYARGAIQAISEVVGAGRYVKDPATGWRAEIRYKMLDKPISLDQIPLQLRLDENKRISQWAPFNKNGGVNEAYLFELSPEFIEELRAALGKVCPQIIAPEVTDSSLKISKVTIFHSEELLNQAARRLKERKNLILEGPPGVGKTFLAKELAYGLLGESADDCIELVQFHPSYSYEDFIRGYRPTETAGKFELRDGPFRLLCAAAEQDGRDRVLIIDEFNRGNVSQIFGELFVLLEADKRGKRNALTPLYRRMHGEKFYVPENIYVIATMNTADRSLALMDFALRRRFAFTTLIPCFGHPSFISWLEEHGM
jgi:hypothetical protein